MFELKETLDVIMWMVFVAAGLAVVFTVYDSLSDNLQIKRSKKNADQEPPRSADHLNQSNKRLN